jgi:hypothetical protein
MPFVNHARVTKMLQWDGTDAVMNEVITHIKEAMDGRPWADANQTIRPDALSVDVDVNGSLIISAVKSEGVPSLIHHIATDENGIISDVVDDSEYKYQFVVLRGDWLSPIIGQTRGAWSMYSVPDSEMKHSYHPIKD